MAGDGYRDDIHRRGVHTPTKAFSTEKSLMRGRSPATRVSSSPSNLSNSPRKRAFTAPSARAIPAKISESLRDPQKIPVAFTSPNTTPSKKVTFGALPSYQSSPEKMAPRKFEGVHSLNEIMEEQNKKQSSTLSQSRKKLAQSKAKDNAKFDPRADDSDSDDESSSSDSSDDEDGTATTNFLAKINGQASSSKPTATPLKKGKRDRDDEVADSDVDRAAAPAKYSAKKAPTKPESSSDESSSSSEEESSESESASNKPAQKTTEKASTTSSSSSEADNDSESEVEEASKPAAKPAVKAANKPAVNGTKSSKTVSTSSSEASSSEESSNENDEDNDSSSDKEASADEEDSDSEEAEQPVAVVDKRNGKGLNVPGFVGKDFVLRQAQGDEDGKDMAEFFAKAKLDGKQLWYFTAPAAIPINVIEKLEIPMDKAKNGDAIFKHGSDSYTAGFEGAGSTSIEVLIPNKKGSRYDSAPQKVDNVLHVKRIMQLAGADPRDAVRPATQPDPPRPQPAGLRARFHPIGVPNDTPLGKIGFDASSDSEGDVEMTAAPALPSSSKKSKRAAPVQSQDSMDIDEPTPKSSKKDKKKSKASRDIVQDSQATVIEVPDSQPLPLPTREKTKKRRASIESISSVGSNPKPDQTKKAPKRKHSSEDDQEVAAAQLQKEAASAEKKAKKVKTANDSTPASAAKKQTAILPPTIPKAGFSFSGLGASNSPAPQPTPKSAKSKSSKKTKETPIQPPSVRRESAVPLPVVGLKQTSPAAATETPKKEKRKSKKADKDAAPQEPKSSKKETPIPPPRV